MRTTTHAGHRLVGSLAVRLVRAGRWPELIAGLLRTHGVRAAVPADDAGGQEPQLQLDGVRVPVARSDEVVAREPLSSVDGTGGHGDP